MVRQGNSNHNRQGVETFDYINEAIFVYKSIDQVISALEPIAQKRESNVLGKRIFLDARSQFAIVFQLLNHNWSTILHMYVTFSNRDVLLQQLKVFSSEQKVPFIEYEVSDVSGSVGYCFVLDGAVVESFEYDGDIDTVRFNSTLRNQSARQIEDPWKFVENFFMSQNAYEPGISPRYFFWPPSLPNPSRLDDSILVRGSTADDPGFVRVDLLKFPSLP